jgi:hypothetical protein
MAGKYESREITLFYGGFLLNYVSTLEIDRASKCTVTGRSVQICAYEIKKKIVCTRGY